MDQQFALSWVHRNIAAFGGDPDNVTIFGESAGGSAIFNQLASPRSFGLFNKAIIESGSLWYGKYAPYDDGLTLPDAERTGIAVATMLECADPTDANCLRSVSVGRLADVIRKMPSYAFGVVVDGKVMPQRASDAIRSGNFNRVPIINGTNHDEWTWVEGLSEAAAGRPLLENEISHHLEDIFGDDAARAAPQYPSAKSGGSAGAASARAVTDGIFACPMLSLNAQLAKFTRVWGYEFDDPDAPAPFAKVSFAYGAAHTFEMRYIFKDYKGAIGALKPLSPAQKTLSNKMVGYWTNFARKGNPNSGPANGWPDLRRSGGSYLSLRAPLPRLTTAAAIDADHKCSLFWRALEN